MGFFSKFEGRMEDTFEGAADKMFDAPISPVQIAKKAEKMMRREKMVGAGKQYAPTLYTVLVNPSDDQRLFGYYPTLAGETETYLTAKAASEGLVMDGQPLVRFIVDEGLKHGKFDIIAEPVAAPIIAQLRSEEMQRYGLGGGMPAYNQAPQAPQAQGYGNPYGTEQAPFYDDSYAQQAPNYGAAQPQDFGFSQRDPYAANPHDPYNQPAMKPPLPVIPDDEIDYSIDYGDYSFNSQEFSDYRENNGANYAAEGAESAAEFAGTFAGGAGAGFADAGAAAGFVGGAAAGFAGGAGAAAGFAGGAGAQAAPLAGTPDTVVFAAGSGNAAPQPNNNLVRARLVNLNENRAYDLATTRLVLGRDRSNAIVVDDINASRTHAELRFEPQGVWVIADLGSTNGTFLNGEEITAQPLRYGDRISIGTTNFTFTQA